MKRPYKVTMGIKQCITAPILLKSLEKMPKRPKKIVPSFICVGEDGGSRGHECWIAPKLIYELALSSIVYSLQYILLALTIRSFFGLPLRATQGSLKGLLSLMELDLSVPTYTQICLRAKSLKVD